MRRIVLVCSIVLSTMSLTFAAKAQDATGAVVRCLIYALSGK